MRMGVFVVVRGQKIPRNISLDPEILSIIKNRNPNENISQLVRNLMENYALGVDKTHTYFLKDLEEEHKKYLAEIATLQKKDEKIMEKIKELKKKMDDDKEKKRIAEEKAKNDEFICPVCKKISDKKSRIYLDGYNFHLSCASTQEAKIIRGRNKGGYKR